MIEQMGIAVLGFLVLIASFVLSGLHKQTSEKVDFRPLAWVTRIIGGLMIIGGILWSTVVIVPAGYRGVLLRFGAVHGTLTEGMNMITPFMDTVELVEVRTLKDEANATAASRDLQVVSTTLALNYHVDPAKVGEIYRRAGKSYARRIIDPVVQESLKGVTAKYTAEELIRNRQTVKTEVENDITRRLAAYNIVVEPSGLSITNFEFSPEFNKAIEQKQVAQQEAEKQKYVLQQAELEQQTEITKAEGRSQAAKLNAAALQVQGGALVIAREWIEKWDGKLPSVSTSGGSGGMIVDINSLIRAAGK